MDVFTIFYLLILCLFLFLATGLPIAFSLGALAILGFFLFLSPAQLVQIPLIIYTYGMSESLLVVPLFILMAEVISHSGFAEDCYNAIYKWMNWLPGSLASSSVIAAAGFAAISGSSTATAATIGIVSIPQMLKRGYNKKLTCGSIAVGGALGILIPPSLSMIVYGIITETSISKLFIAGVLPGILVTIFLVLAITIVTRAKPSLAPSAEKVTWRERYTALPGILPVISLAFAVMGSLYTGIATITEAAGVGAVGSLLLSLCYRRLNWDIFIKSLLRTSQMTGMIFFIVFGGMSFSYLMTSLGGPQQLSAVLQKLSLNPLMVIIAVNVVLIILGCFFDAIGMLVLTMPFLFPLVVSSGFDPIWFGVLVTMNCEIGLLTPPVGLNLYVLRGITPPDVAWSDIILGSLPFTLILLLGMVIITIFPIIALWLPLHM